MALTGQAKLPGPRVRSVSDAPGLRTGGKGKSERVFVRHPGSDAGAAARGVRRTVPGPCGIAGSQPSRFRQATEEERAADVAAIRASGADLVLVGLGCPRQEVWAYEMREDLGRPLMAVGAAFDFLAGSLAMAPAWMQARGLEWLYRLTREPKRLWRRYLILNPHYCWLLLQQVLKIRRFDPDDATAPGKLLRYG